MKIWSEDRLIQRSKGRGFHVSLPMLYVKMNDLDKGQSLTFVYVIPPYTDICVISKTKDKEALKEKLKEALKVLLRNLEKL